jgi:STAS-like domain of unknown function (DUF4325)
MKPVAVKLNVAKNFSRFPAGRFNSDGDFSGERFRDQFLVPALSKDQQVIVELDGTAGYGSSFLEEAFGGLTRKALFAAKELHARLTPQSADTSLVAEIWEYIDQAH